jgi:class 3 adenylate cyclase
MQPDLRDYGQRRDAQGAHPLEARVGINTDEVVVRSVALRAFVLAHG